MNLLDGFLFTAGGLIALHVWRGLSKRHRDRHAYILMGGAVVLHAVTLLREVL